LQQAADKVIHQKLKPGDGGVIGVAHDGSIALVFNSEGMYRGAADSGGRFEVRIWE
jgi:beta-aspartyl-peptidase (threonine type)